MLSYPEQNLRFKGFPSNQFATRSPRPTFSLPLVLIAHPDADYGIETGRQNADPDASKDHGAYLRQQTFLHPRGEEMGI
jgi:hypothetical protein